MANGSPLFSRDVCHWMAIAALHDNVAQGYIKVGKIVSRREFMDMGFACMIGANAIIDLIWAGHKVGMIRQELPAAPTNGRLKLARG